VVLVGYRGSGKSTVGRILAENLGFEFVDADDLLEMRAKKTIPEIVDGEGWEGFRRRELDLWRELAGRRGLVVAAGGGAVTSPEVREIMARAGLVVWLKARAGTIARRIKNDEKAGFVRPPLRHNDAAREAEEMLREREPLYRDAAHAAVETDKLGPGEAAAEIESLFEEEAP
jgi:shikimate kinase